MSSLRWLVLTPVFIFGCARVAKIPIPSTEPTKPSTIPTPLFERTFGNITVGRKATLVLRYKAITFTVDPDLDATSILLPQLDYILLTDTDARHFGSGVASSVRREAKILCPPNEASSISKAGFTSVKGLPGGQRMMLKKLKDFLFVTSLQSKNPLTGHQVNSYLLEFDNGRNLFISGEVDNPDSLRQFVYDLRDEGKDLYVGFFYRQPGMDEATLAKMIALIGPQNAVIIQNDLPNLRAMNQDVFRDALKAELYENPVVVLQNGSEVPF